MSETTPEIVTLVDLPGTPAIVQRGNTLYAMSVCCCKPYRWGADESGRVMVCIGCRGMAPPMPMLVPGEFGQGMHVPMQYSLTEGQESVKAWVERWLKQSVELSLV